MNNSDELTHLILQAAQSQMQEVRLAFWGYVASYDPTRHAVRCIVPTLRDETGTPVLTPWMPLGSAYIGNGYGMQVAPLGGATFDNPTNGEAVAIVFMERDSGVSFAANLMFTDVNAPPFPTLAPGEMGVKHQSGSLLHFLASGDVDVTAAQNFNLNVTGNAVATVTGNVTATVSGSMTATVSGTAAIYASAIKLGKAAADTLYGLLTSIFQTWAEGHVHSNGNAGADTGVPTTTPGAGSVTSILEAE